MRLELLKTHHCGVLWNHMLIFSLDKFSLLTHCLNLSLNLLIFCYLEFFECFSTQKISKIRIIEYRKCGSFSEVLGKKNWGVFYTPQFSKLFNVQCNVAVITCCDHCYQLIGTTYLNRGSSIKDVSSKGRMRSFKRQCSTYTLLRIWWYAHSHFLLWRQFEWEPLKLHKKIIPHLLTLDVGVKICQARLCSSN